MKLICSGGGNEIRSLTIVFMNSSVFWHGMEIFNKYFMKIEGRKFSTAKGKCSDSYIFKGTLAFGCQQIQGVNFGRGLTCDFLYHLFL